MPVVKRFRPLGQVQLARHKTNENTNSEDKSTVVKDHVYEKSVEHFQPLSDQRRRADRKHRYPLRTENKLWDRIWEFSLNCGGSGSGASLNVILNKLITNALDDDVIVKRIMSEFPVRNEFIKIRTWRRS